MGRPRRPSAFPGTGSTSRDSVGETTGASPVFPIRIEDETFVDSSDEPFLIAGDAAWSLIAQLDEGDRALSRRSASAGLQHAHREPCRGLLCLTIPHVQLMGSSRFCRRVIGQHPTLDYSTERLRYFSRPPTAVFLVLLFPAYLGFEGGDEGFYREMEEQGPEAMQQYGAWIGRRFRDQSNIVWVNGGDFEPPPAGLELVQAVADGIRGGPSAPAHRTLWA